MHTATAQSGSGQIVLRRPRRSGSDVAASLLIPTIPAILAAAPAVPLWLVRWSRGASHSWLPLMIPAAVWILVFLLLAIGDVRARRERVVIHMESRELELRRMVLGYGGMLFSASTSRTIPLAAIRTIQTVYNGHMPSGVRIVLGGADSVAEVIEIAYDDFDGGQLSDILAGELGVTPTGGQMPRH